MEKTLKLGLCFLLLFRALFLSAQQDSVVSESMLEQPDSIVSSKSFPEKMGKIAGIAVPSLMVAYGFLSFEVSAIADLDSDAQREANENNISFLKGIDSYALIVTPAALAFGLNLAGNKGKHEFWDMAALYALGNVLGGGITYGLKEITARERPDGSSLQSFPSGHAATAFVAAEFLRQEYGDKSVWYGVGGYTMAAVISVSRVLNNKHRVSDIVAGAGIGILSAKFAYYVYPYLRKTFFKKEEQKQWTVFPGYNEGGLNLNFSYVF